MRCKTACVTFFVFVLLPMTIIYSVTSIHQAEILRASALITSGSVQAFFDVNCENVANSLDWGTLSPGQTRSIEVYIRNYGNQGVTLNLETTNWSPTDAEQKMSLSWDYMGHVLYPNQVQPVTLELCASSQIAQIEYFNFEMSITCKDSDVTVGKVAQENVVNAPANTVYFVYSDPALQSRPEATYDSTSGEILRSLCVNPQNYGFNSNRNWVLPSGEINANTIHGSTVLLFGGRFANNVVKYYETVKKIAPQTFIIQNNVLFFEDRTGTTLAKFPLTALESSNYSEDMFAVMAFYDEESDNSFLVMYGVGWKGTWASGIYFTEVISSNLNAYSSGYYVFHWVDTNQDTLPQNHEIHQELMG